MAASDVISLGIGSPAGIRAFILFGLSGATGGSDTTPDALAGETKSGQTRSATITFTAVTPVGYTAATTISITGGTYSINGGSYVSSSGTLSPGDSFTVRHTSSASYLTAVDSVITLDGTVTGTYRSITTIDPAYTSSRIKINNGFGFGF